jgi:hypothetical protein
LGLRAAVDQTKQPRSALLEDWSTPTDVIAQHDPSSEAHVRLSRYEFCNRSDDIRDLFCAACDRLGVPWTRRNRWTISVARREAVATLDGFVGPKS